ncbi:family 20 glycosylhydrolase [Actinoplanes sp. NPDC024001]|uniref:family 20 glycosylhydrolase n=1 Tax=Actinoplanes sp. NPDC024001 TaxID=3154598 RepID=UPI0033D8CAB1
MNPPVVPAPQRVTWTGTARHLGVDTLRVCGPASLVEAVAELAERCAGRKVLTAGADEADVVVEIDPARRSGSPSGLAPGFDGDESYTVERRTIRAATEAGAFRALTVVVQAAGPSGLLLFEAADAPDLRWRGLTLDVARHFLSVAELEAVVDLLAWYRLNVLHLHLTDNQAWRVEMPGRPALTPAGSGSYSAAEIAGLAEYARRRHITLLPEFDMPGHVGAVLAAYPELAGEGPAALPGLGHLRPGVPAAVAFAEQAVDLLCSLTPTPYVHVGGDEAFSMDPQEYAAFVRLLHRRVRANGKRPVAWQEAARAGAFTEGDVLQQWISPRDAPGPDVLDRLPPEYAALRDTLSATFAQAPHDQPRAIADGAWLLLSPSYPFYLDRRYAEPSLNTSQNTLMARLGHGGYPAARTRDLHDWAWDELPAVAGAQAALWAETIGGVDDLAALLLPRLPVLAEMMWNRQRQPWPRLAARIAAHAPVWERLGFGGYYRSVDVFPKEFL